MVSEDFIDSEKDVLTKRETGREKERERDAGLEDTTVNNLKQSQDFTDCPHDSDMNAYT